MLQAQELRIGNWVYAQSNKLIVDKSVPFQIKVVTKQQEGQYEPIPLTPEILEKCGFKQDSKLPHWIYYRYSIGEWGNRVIERHLLFLVIRMRKIFIFKQLRDTEWMLNFIISTNSKTYTTH